MKLFSSKKRVAAIGAVTAVTLVGGGVAYAYWTSSGTGTGSASTAAGTASLAIGQTSILTAMFPGDVEQDLDVTVTNNGANDAVVTSLGAYITTDAVAPAVCDGSNFLINGSSDGDATAPTLLNWNATELTAGGGSADSLNNTVQFNNLTDTNQDDCKGVGVTIHYVAN